MASCAMFLFWAGTMPRKGQYMYTCKWCKPKFNSGSCIPRDHIQWPTFAISTSTTTQEQRLCFFALALLIQHLRWVRPFATHVDGWPRARVG